MTARPAGWSSPGVITQILSTVVSVAMMVIASWIMTQRDDSKAINDRLDSHSADIARLQAQVEFLRERGGRDGGSR